MPQSLELYRNISSDRLAYVVESAIRPEDQALMIHIRYQTSGINKWIVNTDFVKRFVRVYA